MHNDDKNIGPGKIEIVRMNSIYNSEIIEIEEEGGGKTYTMDTKQIFFLILDCPELQKEMISIDTENLMSILSVEFISSLVGA